MRIAIIILSSICVGMLTSVIWERIKMRELQETIWDLGNRIRQLNDDISYWRSRAKQDIEIAAVRREKDIQTVNFTVRIPQENANDSYYLELLDEEVAMKICENLKEHIRIDWSVDMSNGEWIRKYSVNVVEE